MDKDELRASLVKSNNTILIEKKYSAFDGEGPSWHWWYEIDLDRDVRDMLNHLKEKTWIINNPSFAERLTYLCESYILS